MLPVLCYQDIPVTSNQVHWTNKWRSGERNWLVASLHEFRLIHPVCLVPISLWLMILPWNIFVQEFGQRHFLIEKQAQVTPGDLRGTETYRENIWSFSSKLKKLLLCKRCFSLPKTLFSFLSSYNLPGAMEITFLSTHAAFFFRTEFWLASIGFLRTAALEKQKCRMRWHFYYLDRASW